jgi:hypothetical protein
VSNQATASSHKKASPLARYLKAGRVYRRRNLAPHSSSVDREMRQLMAVGRLGKLAHGLYYVPTKSIFGPLLPLDQESIAAILGTRNFLVFSPSVYNTVGLGTTQLYKSTWIYNHKRHGIFKILGREYEFRIKQRFPRKLTAEFLYVDMLNNLDKLAEDHNVVLLKAHKKVQTMDMPKLQQVINQYANASTRKKFREWING